MTTELVPYADMERMASAIAKSSLFGIKTPDQALALMVIAQAEGRHPGSVAAEYHIIQGRPSLKADAMLARFQAAGGTVRWTEYTDKRVAGVFSHPSGGSIEVDWTMERAKAAKLSGKDNWQAYPRQMLRARVISEGIRTVYPGVASGIYTAEEMDDLPPQTLEAAPPGVTTIDGATGEVLPAEPQRPTATANNGGFSGIATEKQQRLLRAKLDKGGIPEIEFLEAFDIDSVTALPFAKVNDALAWIQSHAA